MIVTPEFAGLDGRKAPPEPVDRTVSPSDLGALKGHYEEYCRQQVTLLLEIIPLEAVRPLYRRTRIWATERGLHDTKDPMSTLRVFCREVLPLHHSKSGSCIMQTIAWPLRVRGWNGRL